MLRLRAVVISSLVSRIKLLVWAVLGLTSEKPKWLSDLRPPTMFLLALDITCGDLEALSTFSLIFYIAL